MEQANHHAVLPVPLPADEYDFPDEFTEQDFVQMDAILDKLTAGAQGGVPALLATATVAPDQPRVTIEVATTEEKGKARHGAVSAFSAYAQVSPFDAYRSWKPLSVSDLTGPAWCELQFDYGLRQKRYLKKVEDRPESFISAAGNVIKAAKTTAIKNERTLDGGRVVHKKLEREIRPEQVSVPVTCDEERWALKLIDMLSCVQDLVQHGFCREMPVFGLIHDHIVVGIIDEISWKPVPEPELGDKRNNPCEPSTPRKPKRTRSSQSPTQRDLSAFVKDAPSLADVRSKLGHKLHLIDSKTRYARSLPSDRDTLPSRLQLMLYHRLLSGVTSQAPSAAALDFRDFWHRVAVNPKKSFSRAFAEQSGLPMSGNDSKWCLDDLVNMWVGSVGNLEMCGVSDELTIVYRTRHPLKTKRTKRTDTRVPDAPTAEEDLQLAQAIRASLLDAGVVVDPAVDQVLAADIGPAQSEEVTDGEEVPDQNIIGTKSFKFDPTLLEDHLNGVFDWWHGIKPPKGVDIEDSGRCRTCEYRDDCEWRELKAQAALEKARSPSDR